MCENSLRELTDIDIFRHKMKVDNYRQFGRQ